MSQGRGQITTSIGCLVVAILLLIAAMPLARDGRWLAFAVIFGIVGLMAVYSMILLDDRPPPGNGPQSGFTD
ncbi:MAG TPA: hypothetical protein PL033_15940 [Candidatus Brocadiia bacterium]|nr:hypothetical protein [Candidatus Brocadiia bacterium]